MIASRDEGTPGGDLPGPEAAGAPYGLPDILDGGDALLVVPPVARISLAPVGPHVLQAVARAAGFQVPILYGSLAFASRVGPGRCEDLPLEAPFLTSVAGERLFARAAHGLPPLGNGADRLHDRSVIVCDAKIRELGGLPMGDPEARPGGLDWLRAAEAAALPWAETLAAEIAEAGFPAVGCTTSFDQTNASFALLRALKRLRPGVLTLVGGANCAGGMAEGIASLDPSGEVVDFVFSGESEASFVAFLGDLRAGRRPAGRIVRGPACRSLDDLPPPSFDDYLRQHRHFLGDRAGVPPERDLTYETSRGCWRGESGTCRFCGINGAERRFRRKSAEKVVREVADLHARAPESAVFLSDTIVPDAAVRALAEAPSGARLYGQVGARIGLARAREFAQAGFFAVLPGFESLDTPLLDVMNKGLTASDNVLALRHLRSVGILPNWNLLWGFPGESADSYRRMAALLPLLHHLPPPQSAYHVYVTRDSPYFAEPARHGIRAVHPVRAYADVFPAHADLSRLPIYHLGSYAADSYGRPEVVRSFHAEAARWRDRWLGGAPPRLAVVPFLGGSLFLLDTRGRDGSPPATALTPDQARFLLTPRPADGSPEEEAALRAGIAVILDGRFVPLATAAPALLEELGCAEANEPGAEPPENR